MFPENVRLGAVCIEIADDRAGRNGRPSKKLKDVVWIELGVGRPRELVLRADISATSPLISVNWGRCDATRFQHWCRMK